jgi:hypothetical protein
MPAAPVAHDRFPLADPSTMELGDEEIEIEDEDDFEFTVPLSAVPGRAVQRTATRPYGDGSLTVRASDGTRRRAVTDLLRKIDRLPANHEYLSLAILRSISLMYEAIKTHRGKAARAQCIRECFDNDAHLRTAMLALLELLDPHVAALMQQADSETLIDSLLVQERTIWQSARGKRANVAPPAEGLLRRAGGPPSRPVNTALPLTRMKPGWRG